MRPNENTMQNSFTRPATEFRPPAGGVREHEDSPILVHSTDSSASSPTAHSPLPTPSSPPTTDLTVNHCPESDYAGWNRYLAHRGCGFVFHRTEWDRVFACYGLAPLRLVAMRSGRIVGVLPLVYQNSLVFGRRLTSLPWFDSAGVIADDVEATNALIDAALDIARNRRVSTTLLRQQDPLHGRVPSDSDKVLLRLQLERDPDALWRRFSPKVRNQVRKAEKAGLTFHSGGMDLVLEFHAVYSENMRDLGSPPHSRRFFRSLMESFRDEARIHVVRHEGKAIGTGLVIENSDTMEIPWASSLRSSSPLCVNHMMYWQILKQACERGFRCFHFGRSSKESGQYHFKKQWGAEDVPVYWYELTVNGQAAASVGHLREEFGWASSMWRKLPLWLAQSLGPRLIRNLP